MLESVLHAYNLDDGNVSITKLGTGLINQTWKIENIKEAFILQRINEVVFRQPNDIAHNLNVIGSYLKKHHPSYFFVGPIVSKYGDDMFLNEEGLHRMFPFVIGSHSKDVLETPVQAYGAAVQFGRFTQLLSGIDIHQIRETLPYFHNLSYRYQQFLECLQIGNAQRVAEAKPLIDFIFQCNDIVDKYEKIKSNPSFKIRVMHHDTKISNVLFNENDKAICVIDLDTVMPGYFFSDVGDMMRTYLSAVSEEENDFSKIKIRDDFYKAITDGYRSEMKDTLTETENSHFYYSAAFMIYMQAVRFLTDYLNDDVYYTAKYNKHNLVRAENQIVLLKRLLEKTYLEKY